MKNKGWFGLLGALAALLLLAVVAAACEEEEEEEARPATPTAEVEEAATPEATPAEEEEAAAIGDTLVWGWTGDLDSFDPPFSLNEQNREASLNTYQTLVQYRVVDRPDGAREWVGLEVDPMLAESWEVEGDTVTFHLRQGVKFYPSGNEMTAEDVKWSFVRTFRVEGGFGRFNSQLAGIFNPEEQIEVVDRYTVKITFTDAEGNPQINPVSITSFKFPQFSIIDSVAAQEQATDDDPWAEAFLKDNTLGTGPYFVSSRSPGVETIFEYVGDDFYWDEAPYFKRVIARVFENTADIVALMQRGEVHGSEDLGIPEYEALENAGLQVLFGDIPDILRADFALEHAALSNQLVRQALISAIPYDQIVQGVYGGRAQRALSIMNPKDPNWKPSWERYSFDLETARQLLEEAGVGGFDLTIFYNLGLPAHEDVALLLQDTWSELGINVSVQGFPTAQFAETRNARTAALLEGDPNPPMSGVILQNAVIWLDDPDAHTDVWLRTGGFANVTGFSNARVDELHAAWRFEVDDPAGRAEAFGEIQDIAAELAPFTPTVLTGRNVALAQGIKGFTFTADPHTRWYKMFVEA